VEPAERETPRLICRRPTGRDGRRYRELLLDPAVAACLFPPPLKAYGRRDAANLLRFDIEHWNTHGYGPWVLIDRQTHAFVGRGGLAWTTVAGRRAVELPWSLLPARWGEGLATEAGAAALEVAREIGLPDVVSFTHVHNVGSQRVMQKIGLERTGEIDRAGLRHVLYESGVSSSLSRSSATDS
jgi:RimJ/RimL family protein N-acetyltransferase